MPRVLRIINRTNLGGPTYNAALLTHYLAPEYETLLVAGRCEESEESSEFICQALGVEVHYIPEMKREINPLRDLKAYRNLVAIIKDFKPDIVHTHAAKAGTLGRLAAYRMKVPVIVHTFHGHVFHSYFNSLKTSIFLKIERFLAARSSAIIAISKQQRHELEEVYKVATHDKFRIIPLGFDLSKFHEGMDEKRREFRTKYYLEPDEIAIGIIGRLVPVKNHGLFLKAAKQILDSYNGKVKFFVIGDGEEREHMMQLCRELNLDHVLFTQGKVAERVIFTSWIRNIDVALAGLDIVVLTSYNEGTPVSLIEAQAAGKPIVSTSVGGIEDVVIPGTTALLVENNNLEELYSKIIYLLENSDERKKISQHGWEHVKEKFHYTRLVRDVRDLYSELLGERVKE